MDSHDLAYNQTATRTSNYTDNVLPALFEWSRGGERCALVTLIGVDGNAPRAEGAQMVVSETGRWTGYISGGCLESAIALEAGDAIRAGRHRILRYGKGSPYLDIRLPCGSGLDILIQPFNEGSLIGEMHALSERREPFALSIDLETGGAALEKSACSSASASVSSQKGSKFIRHYAPALRCVVIGASPIAVKLSELSAQAGFETCFYAADAETLPPLPPQVKVRELLPRIQFPQDAWTAAILAFHDHEREIPVLEQLLKGPCFFLTAIGSRGAQEVRKLALTDAGITEKDIARIQSPAGLVPGLKSAPFVALSILAQAVSAARERGMVS
jgi:xanthine dehydrogenase accessory factor